MTSIIAVGAAVIAAFAAVLLGLRLRRACRTIEAARFVVAEATEKRLSVLEVVGDGIIIVDDDLRITHVNEEGERLLRVGAGEIVGTRLAGIVDELASELVPDIREARRTGAPVHRTLTSAAHGRWVEIRIQPAQNETLIALRDISERTRAELGLRESERRLQLITRHVDALLWTTDREGRFTTVSGAALEALHLNENELLGASAEVLVGEGVLSDVFAGMPARLENVRDAGWLRHHLEPMRDADGHVAGAVGVSIDVTELKVAHEMLFDAAHRDSLTGLPNRLALEARLAETIADARREQRPFGLLFIDLDRFKNINDTLGHNVGDDVLKETATRLEGAVRGGDLIARPGGDEFMVLVPRVRDVKEIQQVAQRLLRALAKPFSIAGRTLHVTASIGAAVFPEDGENAELLIGHADAAMYRAKTAGRNRYALFEPAIQQAMVDRFTLEAELRDVAERGELELQYQPVVSARSGAIVGAEALVRWRHPQRGLLHPDAFIPIAEESGAIVAIDRWVLREACRTARSIRGIAPSFGIAVNTSARALCETDLPEVVQQALDEHGLPACALTIEVTETAVMEDAVTPVIDRLHALGVAIAIDDFGIGYSSLSYLKRLPVSVVKIDRCFVRDIVSDPHDRAIVASIVGMARELGFRVVAEGLENSRQVREIVMLGCDEAQGFVFGAPVAAETLERSVAGLRGLAVVGSRAS